MDQIGHTRLLTACRRPAERDEKRPVSFRWTTGPSTTLVHSRLVFGRLKDILKIPIEIQMDHWTYGHVRPLRDPHGRATCSQEQRL